ncbi:glycosyltransferase [Conexibacter stalactiti]|uniref:Glycosyltransferase n=1 Tax=Conexibacter stalactiti TaxID=1940611 RepID=A0ABU4HVE8_9ACTN|nr:glycosyltransferase [Conexibacter stalactiti]MDW5597263.1 glycosyltransferase [Conexibacter stalactiti]MEC5037905.1 glycosyltransferase [Conexibacter stalactiti]
MQIVSLVPEGAPSSLYRAFIPMQALALEGHRVHIEERNAVGDPGPLLGSDVVQIFRLTHAPMRRLVRQLQAAGVAVVWDNDFDAASAPQGHPVSDAFRGVAAQQWRAGELAMLKLADLVTVPTDELAERYHAAGAREVRVVENMLPPTFERPRTLPERGLTIGWACMQEHSWDFERLGLREVFARVLEQHLHVRLLAIGLDMGISSRRYEFHQWQPYQDLPGLMARCDLLIAPLADVPFNRTRSNIKLKEYAAAGVPWLASPVGDYAWMGEEQGGRLVADGDWRGQIEALVRDEGARHRLAVAGRRWAAGEVVLNHVGELEEVFGEAVGLARA